MSEDGNWIAFLPPGILSVGIGGRHPARFTERLQFAQARDASARPADRGPLAEGDRMFEARTATQLIRDHYQAVWSGQDPWGFASSEFEQIRYARQLAMVNDRRYFRALEVGCGAGAFTRQLAMLVDELTAVDVAPAAIDRAKCENSGLNGVSFEACDIMEFDLRAAGPWDLIVMSETIYCLGWLYPLFNVGWLLSEFLASLNPGGRLLLANTYGGPRDFLLLPWLIDTYRDLVSNVGFSLEKEEIFRGTKDEVVFEVLMSLFTRPAAVASGPSVAGLAET